jgi:hypothetical protein
MASYYSDPNLQAALLAQAAYEAERQKEGGDQGGGFIDALGKAALIAGAGVAAGLGAKRLLANRAARTATQNVSVEDLGSTARKAEETVRRAAGRQQTAPPPSQRPPAPSQPPTARPTPGGMVERLGTMEENARVARAERMPGIVQTDLSNISPERARATLGIQKVSVEDLGNPPAATGGQGLLGQFSPYGQLQEGVDDVISEVKALPPTRPSGTDFLTNQLGGRGYIEQTVLNRAAEQAAGDLIDEVSAFSNKGARSEIARQAASIQSQERKNLWNLVSEIQNETLVNQQQTTRAFNVDQAINALESGEDQMTGRTMSALQRNEDIDIGTVDRLQDTYEAPLRTQTQPTESLANQQDASVNAVADMMPDGRPLDQAEGIDLRTGQRFSLNAPRQARTGLGPGQSIELEDQSADLRNTSAARFMEAEREKISQEMAVRGRAPMPQDVEAALALRLGKGASSYGPKYTARRQAMELLAKTGDPIAAETTKRFGLSPVTFETFENMPAAKQLLFQSGAPMSLEGYPSTELSAVVPKTGIEVDVPGIGRVDISTLRKPVVTENTALSANDFIEGRKASGQNWLAGITNEIEPQQNEIINERRALIQAQAETLKPQLEQARAANNVNLANTLEGQMNVLHYQYKNPQSHPHRRNDLNLLNARLASAQRKIAADAASLQKKFPTTLSDWSGEANRVFGITDPVTGEFIPETMELRTERRTADLGAKGGGGRKVAEYTGGEALVEQIRAIQGGGRYRDYDPETGAARVPWSGDKTQTGREIDVYGVRPSRTRAADVKQIPSTPRYTADELVEEAMRMSQADPTGDVPVVPIDLESQGVYVGESPLLIGDPKEVTERLGARFTTPASRGRVAAAKTSIDVSENIRRIRQSAPPEKAQSLVNQYLNTLRKV